MFSSPPAIYRCFQTGSYSSANAYIRMPFSECFCFSRYMYGGRRWEIQAIRKEIAELARVIWLAGSQQRCVQAPSYGPVEKACLITWRLNYFVVQCKRLAGKKKKKEMQRIATKVWDWKGNIKRIIIKFKILAIKK